MQIRSRNQNGNPDPIYGVIATAAIKDKFLDFRDALTIAYLEDYAMIQGIGGKNHAPNSGIRLLIQDNTGKSAVPTANAIVPCYVINQMFEVCRENLCAPKSDKASRTQPKAVRVTGMEAMQTSINTIGTALATLFGGSMAAAANIIRNKGSEAGPLADFGGAIKKAYTVFTQAPQAVVPSSPYTEFAYHQDRVNIYKKDAEGFCPVNSCDIKRTQYRNDGQISDNPWSIIISTYEAKAVEHDNGTFSPDMKSMRGQSRLFVQISDQEMWRCVYAVERFIRLWEITYGTQLIKAGIAAKEKQQMEFRNK
jgi:hypothetical protein